MIQTTNVTQLKNNVKPSVGTARARRNFWQDATRSDKIAQIDKLAHPDVRARLKRAHRAIFGHSGALTK
jgi:hypothetical protein